MSKKLKRLVLVDGNALVHRAFHALPHLSTKKGELVNAVYGFTTLLLKAIHDLQPEYVAVTFDLAGPTFRHETYKEYKATRVKAPDELYNQFDRVKEIVRTLNIPIFEVKGFEADDVIGTLAEQAAKQGVETLIVTGDMDTLQLVSHLVKVYTMRKGFTDTVIYDSEAVKEKYGLTPEQFVDYKALKGDASDNIPGVDGIGEKTAATLVKEFGSLDKLYEYLESEETGKKLSAKSYQLKARVKELLLNGKKQAYDSQHLSQIVCDVPIELDLTKASLKDYDREKAISLFQELEFRSLLNRLPGSEQVVQTGLFANPPDAGGKKTVTKVKDAKYKIIKTDEELDYLIKKLAAARQFVLDTETDYLNGPVIGLSFSVKAGEAYYIPSSKNVLKILKPILEDPKIKKIGHNMKYDYLTLRKEGIAVAPLYFDTMIASYLLNPTNRQHGLDAVAFTELGVEKIPLAELIGVKKLDSLANVEVEKVGEYACEDADITYRLFERYEPMIADSLKKIFFDLEMPLVPILATMEEVGIKVDVDYLKKLSSKLHKRQEELIKDIYHEAGQEFNINSTQQLSTVLFDKLQLKPPMVKKTKTGISTAASELEKMRGLHPIIDLLFEYRELTKLLNTYIDVLPAMVDKEGRIHTSYSQTIAATGRLSSLDPNLQNIPIRTDVGKQIRKAFVAEKGNKLLSVDYSQIELRIVAHLADDENMKKVFAEGRDIHQEVADALGVDRRVGKTLNFAVLYGQGAYSTALQLGITQAEAKDYIDRYFATYKNVRKFLDKVLAAARAKGYTETLFGRRRYVPEITSSNFQVRSGAERAAANHPIQGTAADLMKMAMIKIADSGLIDMAISNKPSAISKLLLQVHDELVFEVESSEVEKTAKKVKELMESVYKLSVPITAEAKAGDNWEEMTALNL